MTSFITGGASPPQSLGLQLQVTAGVNQLQRKVGNYSALYLADGANIQNTEFELDQLNIWTSNTQETYQRLVIACSGVLVLEIVKPDNTIVQLEINRMCVIDSAMRSFKLTNANTELVRGSIHMVSNRIA